MTKPKVYVIGVGMTKFVKPGSVNWDYPDMVKEAVTEALNDCGLQYKDVQQATVSYLYGGTCCGQRALYEIGFTGIPIYNVNNACASGSSGVYLCKQILESGNADVVMATGFEKMAPGSLENMGGKLDDRAIPVDKHIEVMSETYGIFPAPITCQMFGNAGKEHMEKYGNADVVLATGFEKMRTGSLENMKEYLPDRTDSQVFHRQVMQETYGLTPNSPMTCQMFGNAGREHMEKYGTKREHFAKIAYKNHLHSVNNPKSQFQKEFSFDQVMNARKIYDFVGLLECSPTSDGAAAAILCSEKFLDKNPHLRAQAVEIVGMELGTDEPSVFAEKSNIKMIGFDMIKRISERLYKNTGLCPNDVQVIECHDCFAPNELITYEAIGLCPVGKAGEIVDRGDNTYGGKWVVNPSGGLISKGHPIGATGVAQVVELSNQLRGRCGKRQVPNCKVAMQHNIGIGGAGVVALYKMAGDGNNQKSVGGAPSAGELQSDFIFNEIKERAASEGAEYAKQVNASFRFTVSGNGVTKKWTIDLKKNPPFIGENDEKVDVEITLTDDILMQIATGKLKPDQAFMQGKMKMKGNLAKAMKLRSILDPSKLKSKL